MDLVLFWNDVALEANRISFTIKEKQGQGGPTLSSRAMGIVHLAIHDAYIKTSGSALSPYKSGLLPPATGASVDAAISTAAYVCLNALYPTQKEFFDKKLSELTHNPSGHEAGQKYGHYVANEILKLRKNDPSNGDTGYIPPIGKFQHKPDPNNSQGYLAPYYGAKSPLFAATNRHELNPPNLVGPSYKKIVKEVKEKGIAPELMGTLPNNASKRTVDETLIGLFWAYDGANGLGTPPRLYNQIVRAIAKDRGNTLEQNVRLFAYVNTAMADAGILAWDQKYIHNLWRPVHAIREFDQSMGWSGTPNNNIDNVCDPLWLPLGAPKSNVSDSNNFTPDFPAYPSGHATFGAAALHVTRLFYGIPLGNRSNDTLFAGCDFVSDEFDGITRDNKGTIRPRHARNFPGGLWQMIIENGLSRVFLGVHFSFDSFAVDSSNNPLFDQEIGGVDLGLKIAEDIFQNGLKESTIGPRP